MSRRGKVCVLPLVLLALVFALPVLAQDSNAGGGSSGTTSQATTNEQALAAIRQAEQEVAQAREKIERGQRENNPSLLNEGIAELNVALRRLQLAQAQLDLNLRNELTGVLDEIDRRSSELAGQGSGSGNAIIPRLQEIERRLDRIEQRLSNPGSGGSATPPSSAELGRRLEETRESAKKNKTFWEKLKEWFDRATTIWEMLEGGFRIIQGIAQMRNGVQIIQAALNAPGLDWLSRLSIVGTGVQTIGAGQRAIRAGINQINRARERYSRIGQ